MQESELYGLLATAKSLQIKGLTDSDDNSGIGDERAAGPSFWSERERERGRRNQSRLKTLTCTAFYTN